MNKKIYLLLILALAVHVTFGQQISNNGRDSVKLIISRFGQLLDLSTATGAKQTSARPVDRMVAEEFKGLFNMAFTLDTTASEKDSLVIVSFLDPNIRLFECYNIKNPNDSLLRREVDSCLNSKKTLEHFPKLSVNQFIDTVYKYYTQTVSDINENDILIRSNQGRAVGKKRYQVVADAPLKEFRGNIDVNYSAALGIKEYRYQAPDLQKKEQLALNMRFYISYGLANFGSGKTEANFKIDSVILVKPVSVKVQAGYTKSRSYLEPFIGYGISSINLNTDDPRFDDLSKDNSAMLIGGINASFFFNDRRLSRWDVGFTTGIAYKTLRSNYSLGSYSDSLLIADDATAAALGGPYDLYVNAVSLDQNNRINVLEVPVLFALNYNFSPKRTLGIYSRLGGVFNLVVSNKHTMSDGSVTYTGHIERLIQGEYVDYYFDSDIPEYGFSTYEADVNESTDLALNPYYIGGRLNLGVYGMNKTQTVGWHIGPFFDLAITDMMDGDHVADASLTRGRGYMSSFYEITDALHISNWGIEFGISVQLFKEKIQYLKSK